MRPSNPRARISQPTERFDGRRKIRNAALACGLALVVTAVLASVGGLARGPRRIAGPKAAAVWQAREGMARALTSAPGLGNYPNMTVNTGGDTILTPDAAPVGASSINVSTRTDFKGTFSADPITGVVHVTNAHPLGTYTLTVRAFDSGGASTTGTLTLTVQSAAACSDPLSFTSAPDPSNGALPYSVAIGDFNNDGRQDIAVANSGPNTVSIRLGGGAGDFTGTTEVSVGDSPFSVAIGDFNNDGRQDIAVADGGSDTVSIRLGDGAGNFSGATEVSVGRSPHSVAIGDFNNDGKQDIAVGNADGGTASIRLGDGAGDFIGTTEVSVGSGSQSIAIGDFNGDGRQDIATANYGSDTVSIRLGDGAGGFTGSTEVSVGPSPQSVAVGDFNNDGKQDIATANGSSFTVSIRLGDGAGNFIGTTEVSIGGISQSIAIGDFNGDGRQDIATANTGSSAVSIRLGDGTGNFSGTTEFSVGGPQSIAIGDFNGDGRQDIATANSSSDTVSIRLAAVCSAPISLGNYPNTTVTLGANTTVTPGAMPTNTTSLNVSTSTDFKGSVSADPATGVVRVTNAHPAGTYTVTVTASDGAVSATRNFTLTVDAGTACAGVSGFTAAADSSVGSGAYSVAVGDFNNDGKQDIATANSNSNTISIRLGDGAGGFTGSTDVSVSNFPFSVALGDFNNDGKQDIATSSSNSNTVSIRLGDGAGGFTSSTEVGVGNAPQSVVVGDFNNDGKQDIATANYNSNTVSIRLGDGAGGFTVSTEVAVGSSPISVAVGDFNNDGRQDIAAANSGAATVSIRLGDGAGGFTGSTEVGVGSTPGLVAVGDFNNDGKQDFAAANVGPNTVSIRLGDGTGGFSGSTEVGVGNFPFSVALGDFNNDGKQDIATSSSNSNTVSIRLGDGAGGFTVSTEVGVGTGPSSVAVGDFNNDGKQDFAAANVGSNSVSIRLGECVALTITPGGPTTFCTGGSVTLTSSLATGNQWYLNGNPIGGATSQTYIATASGDYTVVVSGVSSATTTVTVNPIPSTPTITPGGPTTFCAGSSVALTSSSASGNQWYLNGNPIGGATNQVYSATASGNYSVTTTASGCTSAPSAATTVTVNPIPATPTITPAGPTILCNSGSVMLTSSSASGNQWYLNGNPIGGATSQTYSATAAGNYTVLVTASGCTSNSSAPTTVNPNTPPTLTYSTPQSVTFDGSITVTPTTASDDNSITGYSVLSVAPALTTAPTVNSSGVVSIANAQPAGSHVITIRATDGCGANTDASFTLNVPSPAVITGTKTVSGSFDSGSTITYTVVLINSGLATQLDNPGNEFTDVLPAGLTLVSANATSGTSVATVGTNTVTWSGSITNGGAVTITINATINGLTNGTVSNQGTISYDADGNGTNESSAVTDDPGVAGNNNPTGFTACTTNAVVTTNADSDAGSLRHALVAVCPGGTITFDAALNGQTITLTTGQLLLDKDVTITGPGASILSVSGNNTSRVFKTTPGVTVTISDLTITGGSPPAGGYFQGQGGGIWNDSAVLTLLRCAVTNNRTNRFKFPEDSSDGNDGGGISNRGSMTVYGCIFSGNVSSNSGGGIANFGVLTIANSTFVGNGQGLSSNFGGGGFYNEVNGFATVSYTTMTGNTGGLDGGGAINDYGTLRLTNSIFSGNTSPTNNDVQTAGATLPGGTGKPVTIDNCLIGGATGLGTFGNYGGNTQTVPLLPGSNALNFGTAMTALAVDATDSATSLTVGDASSIASTPGNYLIQIENEQILVANVDRNSNSLAVQRGVNGSTAAAHSTGAAVTFATDQRGAGFPRIVYNLADIGAFEVQAGTPDHLAFTSQPSINNPGTTITPAVTVQILDAGNNLTTSTANVTLAFDTDPSSGTLGGTTTVAAINGTASFSDLTINNPGNGYTLTASSTGLVGSTSNPFNILSPAIVFGTKTVSGNFNIGNTVTYAITLTNTGPAPQLDNPGNEFTDVLPASLTLVSATATGGTAVANIGTNTVTWNGSILNGNAVTVSIQAKIKSGTQGAVITNQGTIAYDADGNGTDEASAITDDPGVVGSNNPTGFKVNTAPVADSQSVLAEEDTAKTITLTGTDAENSPLTFTVVGGPSHGALSGTAPNLTYTPVANYNGPDSFTFKVNDGSTDSVSQGTVSITVHSIADTPSVTNATTIIGKQTTSGLVITRNAADGSEVQNFKITNIQNGTLYLINGTSPISNGSFITVPQGGIGLKFTPTPGLASPTVFSFDAQAANNSTGDGLSNAATATITVGCSATNVVTNSSDGGAGSLRDAILNACDGGTITFDMTPGHVISPITLTSGELIVTRSLMIQGPGASQLAISGNNSSRVLNVTLVSPGVLTVSGLTISDGKVSDFNVAGGIRNQGSGTVNITDSILSNNNTFIGGGGAIYNESNGIINITRSTLSNNSTVSGLGGAIYNSTGTISLTNSTLSQNAATFLGGGGIANNGAGTVIIVNSTFSQNSASSGGAIFNSSAGSINITNGTFSGNLILGTLSVSASGIHNTGGPVKLRNTIIADSLIGAFTTLGHNLIGQISANATGFTVGVNNSNGDLVGTALSPVLARLAPLGSYGGATQTFALLPGSPGINAGDDCVVGNSCTPVLASSLAQDQRGLTRVGTVDIGAFESRGFNLSIQSGNDQATPINTTFAAIVAKVSSVAGEPVAGGQVSFAAPVSGTGALIGGNQVSAVITVDANGLATASAKANGLTGSYIVLASALGASSPVTFNLTNAKGSQTIPFGPLANRTYGDAPFTITVAASSGLPVSFQIVSGPATVSGNTVTITGVGTVVVRATQAGDSNYNAATPVDQSFTIAKANQTINFGALSNKTYGDPPFNVGATSTSGLGVTFSISSGPATISGNTVTVTGAGTVVVRASQAGDSNYNAAIPVDRSVTVAKANQTITFAALSNKTYGDPPFSVIATASSGMTVTFSIVSGPATITGDTVSITGAGTIVVRASQAGDGNHNAATPVDRMVTVVKAASTTTVASSQNPSEFGQIVTFTATVSSPLGTPTGTVQFKDDGASAGSPVALTGGKASASFSIFSSGNHNVTAVYSGDTNYVSSIGTLSGGETVNAQVGVSVNDSSVTEGDTGTKGLTFTVTLSAASTQTVSVNYQTADGTATVSDSDYLAASGTLTFNPGETNKTVTVQVNGDVKFEADETYFVNLSNAVNSAISDNQGLGTIVNDDVQGGIIKFSATDYSVGEADGQEVLTVTRTGDTSLAANVDYSSADVTAKEHSDYSTAVGTVKFAAGESSKTITVLINNDSYVDPAEIFTVTLSNPTRGAQLASPGTATVLINDDDTQQPTTNIIDDASAFVRQQYHDFLNREPEAGGLAYWTNEITKCGSDQACIRNRRIDVSAAFFMEQEFQQTGFYVYRVFKASNGRAPLYIEYMRGRNEVLGGPNLAQQQAEYAVEQVNPAYAGKTNAEYVDQLYQNAGVTPSSTEKDALVNGLNGGAETRGSVLQKVAGNQTFTANEKNAAFVLAEYFGYLRRDPEPAGFQFWLDVLNNKVPGNFRSMVCAFITSAEYQERFSSVMTHTNAECQ
jgi:hypothetical protein